MSDISKNITRVYEFAISPYETAFIYSERSQENPLRFYYHILTTDSKQMPIIIDAGNVVRTIQETGIVIRPISQEQDSDKYTSFLTAKTIAEKKLKLEKKEHHKQQKFTPVQKTHFNQSPIYNYRLTMKKKQS